MAGTVTHTQAAAPSTDVTAAGGLVARILRDIARCGLAGLIVGVLVAGIGGRLVMRLAAVLVPAADSMFTENGNRIGVITLGGSAAIVVFAGIAVAVLLGVMWVVFSPWLPRSTAGRALAATPVAIAFGAPVLVERFNPDFFVLGHHPLVAASLVALVAATAPAMAVTDAWLERRLPRPDSIQSPSGLVYLSLTAIGGFLGALLLVTFMADESWVMKATILLTGLCALAWWWLLRDRPAAPPRSLVLTARVVLTAGTVMGLVFVLPAIRGAFGVD